MQPDAQMLLDKIGLEFPPVGFYDAPDPALFQPLVEPEPGRRACIFAFYEHWRNGQTLRITKENYGCRGAAHWLCGIESRDRESFVRFLVDDEGLKASHALMNQWLDARGGYKQEHPDLLIGPLQQNQYPYLKTVTFFANPDQLSALVLGAQYYNAPGDPPPVIAPFGSGCSQLVALFDDLTTPQAVIGATDIAMRQHLPQDILALTVTKAMFERLCELDERSFLFKPFWRRLRTARGLA